MVPQVMFWKGTDVVDVLHDPVAGVVYGPRVVVPSVVDTVGVV